MNESHATILLVDDDPDFLECHRLLLESAGYGIVTASDPDQAWQLLRERTPDLVVTDLMMSRLDAGFSLARRIKLDPDLRRVPVIIATAASGQRGYDFRPQSPDDLAAMHADAYFDKPVPPQPFLERISFLLQDKPVTPPAKGRPAKPRGATGCR